MKQSKLIAPAFAVAMILTGCGGRNRNDNNNTGNDMNRVDNTPAVTVAPQKPNSIERSNESARDDIARNSESNRNSRNTRIKSGAEELASDVVEGGRELTSDVVNDARDAVDDMVDGRDDNDGTYRADERGNVRES